MIMKKLDLFVQKYSDFPEVKQNKFQFTQLYKWLMTRNMLNYD